MAKNLYLFRTKMKTKNFPFAMWRYCIFAIFMPVLLMLTVTNPQEASAAVARRGNTNTPLGNDPSNIHAIIVSSSRYWFNYRHAINALGMYEIYRQNGIPDENIILSKSIFAMHCIFSEAVSALRMN